MHGCLGAAVKNGNLRAAHILQSVHQKTPALMLRAAHKRFTNYLHGLPVQDDMLRRLTIAEASFCKYDVLIKLACIPMTPLLMRKVFFLAAKPL